MKMGGKMFQIERACFGLSTLSYLWMQVMGVFLKKRRKQGLLVFIYLDDILLLKKFESPSRKQSAIVLEDLSKS